MQSPSEYALVGIARYIGGLLSHPLAYQGMMLFRYPAGEQLEFPFGYYM